MSPGYPCLLGISVDSHSLLRAEQAGREFHAQSRPAASCQTRSIFLDNSRRYVCRFKNAPFHCTKSSELS